MHRPVEMPEKHARAVPTTDARMGTPAAAVHGTISAQPVGWLFALKDRRKILYSSEVSRGKIEIDWKNREIFRDLKLDDTKNAGLVRRTILRAFKSDSRTDLTARIKRSQNQETRLSRAGILQVKETKRKGQKFLADATKIGHLPRSGLLGTMGFLKSTRI